MYVTSTEIQIPFHDVDSMQVAWHGHYLKYFEVARCEFLQSLGYSYDAMTESGYVWPIVDLRIKYVRPLRFGQKIRVQCSLREWECRLRIDYTITDAETSERLTKGYTIQVAIELATAEMCFETPEAFRLKLKNHIGRLPE